jgi:hypothetical protein
MLSSALPLLSLTLATPHSLQHSSLFKPDGICIQEGGFLGCKSDIECSGKSKLAKALQTLWVLYFCGKAFDTESGRLVEVYVV